jgi:hypothetical protein
LENLFLAIKKGKKMIMKKINYFCIAIILLKGFNAYAQEPLSENKNNEKPQSNKVEIASKNKKKISKEEVKINEENQDDIEAEVEVKPDNDISRFNNSAIVQALNKTTAKTLILTLKVGEKTSFGSLKIIAHKCWQSPLEQKPENKILLEIFEFRNESEEKTQEKRIFYGWMFSSSPSISSLEHPIYDITALNCKNK